MKIRMSFVANSSSSSFIILTTHNEANITVNDYIKISLPTIFEDMFSDNDEDTIKDNNNSSYIFNYTPKTINNAFDCAIKFMQSEWLWKYRDIDHLTSLESYMEYYTRSVLNMARSSSKLFKDKVMPNEETIMEYYKCEYEYISNTYDMLKRMINEYYKNFIKHNKTTIESYAYSCEYFKEFYKYIMNVDNHSCFTFEQYCRYLNIHNNGIFKVNPLPIDHDYTFELCNRKLDKKKFEHDAICRYKKLIDCYNNTTKTLLGYIYCHYNDGSFQEFEMQCSPPNDSIESLLLEIYEKTHFLPPFVDFDIIATDFT